MAADKATERGLRCVGGIVLLALCLFLSLALSSYDWQDISLLHAPPINPPCNLIGPVGAWFSFVLFSLLQFGHGFRYELHELCGRGASKTITSGVGNLRQDGLLATRLRQITV